MRVAWYNMMYAIQDEQTQINGAVEVLFAVGDTIRGTMDSKSFQTLPTVVEATPLYWTSMHLCFEDENFAHALGPISIIQGVFNAFQRMKLRLHHGKEREICFLICKFKKKF